jgi:hypothetical protein
MRQQAVEFGLIQSGAMPEYGGLGFLPAYRAKILMPYLHLSSKHNMSLLFKDKKTLKPI